MLLSTMAGNVGRLRRARGWTRLELAARAGVSSLHVQSVERRQDVPVTVWVRLAAALGVTPGDLLQDG